MKNTFRTILMYVVILALLLGVAAVAERLSPEKPVTEETAGQHGPDNAMSTIGATSIVLDGEKVHITGVGASASGSVVTVVYPGTYHVTGTLTAGQLVVDCGDYEGNVYLVLDGVSVTCPSGPALLVNQCDEVTLYIAENSENTLKDGESYTVTKGQEIQSGACILSDDDLVIDGSGALCVCGNGADGIRTRDGLDIKGGTLTVYAAEHGVQGSDYVNLETASLTVAAYGDGVRSTKGNVTVAGASVAVTSGGDGLSAVGDVYMNSGTLSVTACGGSGNYVYITENAISAKGIKGENVTVTGGTLTLDTADDAMKAERNVTVTGGSVTIRSGDDAISAGDTASVLDGTLTVEKSYEAIQGLSVTVAGGSASLLADNKAIESGTGGFSMTGGTVYAEAPCCVSSDADMSVTGGSLYLTAEEADESVLSFVEGAVSGGTVIALGEGVAEDFLWEGALSQSLVFTLRTPAEQGSQAVLSDGAGHPVLTFTLWRESSIIQIASGALGIGQSYTLTVGNTALTGILTEECTVVG